MRTDHEFERRALVSCGSSDCSPSSESEETRDSRDNTRVSKRNANAVCMGPRPCAYDDFDELLFAACEQQRETHVDAHGLVGPAASQREI